MQNNNYSDLSKELDFDNDFNNEFGHFEQEAQFKSYPKQRCEDNILYCSNLEDVTEALRNAGYIKKLI